MARSATPRADSHLGLLLAALLLAGGAAPQQGVLRCGWFENPTPGNAWLTDRDDQWIIGTQGGAQADGDWPRFGRGEWVRRQASYGYGCACMRVVAAEGRVQRILTATARPLEACRNDKALREPGRP